MRRVGISKGSSASALEGDLKRKEVGVILEVSESEDEMLRNEEPAGIEKLFSLERDSSKRKRTHLEIHLMNE